MVASLLLPVPASLAQSYVPHASSSSSSALFCLSPLFSFLFFSALGGWTGRDVTWHAVAWRGVAWSRDSAGLDMASAWHGMAWDGVGGCFVALLRLFGFR